MKPEFIHYVKQKEGKEIFIDQTGKKEIYLPDLMKYLAARQITSLFVEGGAGVLGAFLGQGLGDKIFIFTGNQILGEGLAPFSGFKVKTMREALQIKPIRYRQLSGNLLIYGDIKRS